MRYNAGSYDIVVIGAGHAGCEAGLAAARMGCKTLVCTLTLDSVAMMPCNPNIGGTAKGHLVREIDALGGEMGVNIDHTFIQSKMLNTSKGPAVHSLRAQADKKKYQERMKKVLETQENLHLRQLEVVSVEVEDGKVKGVLTKNGAFFECKAVIMTSGTYLQSRIIIGDVSYSQGPNGLSNANELSKSLIDLGIDLRRFKTGTPARINKRSVDFSKMIEQPGDEEIIPFSFISGNIDRDQVSCWLTYTNEYTHKIIQDNLDRAPMFTGVIEGVGPRYCPSIEDKIVRFSDKPRHQLFLEPEGRNTDEYYVQGLSTSLPEEVQQEMVHSIDGLEHAEMMRPGYAIEYDVVSPYQLRPTLETKLIKGLYTAGQTNGTSGYEEAAGQGFIAGVNAGRRAKGLEEITLKRSDAYIGVMIDDLVTKGTNEPYRLLTSRAEYRLILRHDNADLRLTELGHEIGLISDERYAAFEEKKAQIEAEKQRLSKIRIKPNAEVNAFVEAHGDRELKDGVLATEFLRRPYVTYQDLLKFIPAPAEPLDRRVIEQIEIQFKYEGYIKKEYAKVEKLKRMEAKKIPARIDYSRIEGIATEAQQKLAKIQPETLAQAGRISGVNPADLSILAVYIEQGKIARVDD